MPDGPPRPEDQAGEEDWPRQRQWREKLEAEQAREAAPQGYGCRGCLVVACLVMVALVVGAIQLARGSFAGTQPQAVDPQFRQASADIILSPSSPVVTGHVALRFRNLVNRPQAGLSLGFPEFAPSTGSAQGSSPMFREPLVRLTVRGPRMDSAPPCVGPCEITLTTDSCPASWSAPPPGSEMCTFAFPFRIELATDTQPADGSPAAARVRLTAAASVCPGCSLPPDLAIDLHLDQSPALTEGLA